MLLTISLTEYKGVMKPCKREATFAGRCLPRFNLQMRVEKSTNTYLIY